MSDIDLNSPGHGGAKPASGRERRRFPRVDVQQRVWCEKEGFTLLVQTRNISRGGVCVYAVKQPENGTELYLSFRCGEDELLHISAEVVWRVTKSGSCRPGLGLRFLSPDAGELLFERFLLAESSHGSMPPALSTWAVDTAGAKSQS